MKSYAQLLEISHIIILILPLPLQIITLFIATILNPPQQLLQVLSLNTLAFFALLHLFGASDNTMLPSMLLSLMTIHNPIYTLEIRWRTGLILAACWLGAFVLPLDKQLDYYVVNTNSRNGQLPS
jgi:hypothetical protein